jgi:hypothetical protein
MVNIETLLFSLYHNPVVWIGILFGLALIFFPKFLYENLDSPDKKFNKKHVRNSKRLGVLVIIGSITLYVWTLYLVSRVS